MNSYKAKKIPLEKILSALGREVIERKKGGRELWYCSPFREEKTASFNILLGENVWYDFGEGKGGNVLDFVMHLKSCSVSQALAWLAPFEDQANYQIGADAFKPISSINMFSDAPNSPFTLRKQKVISATGLVAYLGERGIDLALAKQYLEEIHYDNQAGKSYYGLGMRNEFGGYEVRNKYFKSCVGRKGLTFIADPENRQKLSVFEGFFDFLSCLQDKGLTQLKGDVVILHSLSFTKRLEALVQEKSYQTLYDFLDNDEAGDKQRTLIDAWGIQRQDMRYLYTGFKDYNEKLTRPTAK